MARSRPSGVVLAWAAEHGLDLNPPVEMPEFVSWVGEPPPDWGRWTPEELASRAWSGVDLWWRKDWAPMDVSIRDLDDWEAEEVTAFPPSRQRDRVLGHLTRTRFVVSTSLPVSPLPPDALWEAAWVLLDYFTAHHVSLVHIEGECFFAVGLLVLATIWSSLGDYAQGRSSRPAATGHRGRRSGSPARAGWGWDDPHP